MSDGAMIFMGGGLTGFLVGVLFSTWQAQRLVRFVIQAAQQRARSEAEGTEP